MLPFLITKFCSLKVGKSRLAISLFFNINNEGVIDITSYEFYESVIEVKLKLSYENYEKIINSKDVTIPLISVNKKKNKKKKKELVKN